MTTPDEIDLAGIEPRSPECLSRQPGVHGSCDGTAVGGPHCACPCHVDMHSHLGPTAAQFTEAMREGKARMRAVGLDVDLDREIDLAAGTRRRAIVAKVLYKTMSTKESFDLAAEILAALDEDDAEHRNIDADPAPARSDRIALSPDGRHIAVREARSNDWFKFDTAQIKGAFAGVLPDDWTRYVPATDRDRAADALTVIAEGMEELAGNLDYFRRTLASTALVDAEETP